MSLIEDIVNWTKNQIIYMAGRGLLGVGMVLGGIVGTGGGSALALPIAVIGTAGLQALRTWRNERTAERQLLNAYREEVAATLGMNSAEVTIEQLHEVANGNPEKGSIGNPILKEALDRNGKRFIMQFITSGLAALSVVIGGAFLFENLVSQANQLFNFKDALLSNAGLGFLGQATAAAGIMFVAGSGMSLLNLAYDSIGERYLGIHQPSAHDLIVGINRQLESRRLVSQEQVFGVFVAANPELASRIEEAFGKPYNRLNPRQQFVAIEEHGRGMPIRQLTDDLNRLQIKPQELAFAAVGQASGVAPHYEMNLREAALKEKTAADVLQEIKQAALGTSGKPPANDNVRGFAGHFTPREPTEKQSFVERYAPERTQSQIDRVLQQLRKSEVAAGDVER